MITLGNQERSCLLSRIVDNTSSGFTMNSLSDAWEDWERLRQDPVLGAISSFQKYVAAIEKEAVKVARSQNRGVAGDRRGSWEISPSTVATCDISGKRFQEGGLGIIGRRLEASWATSAEVRQKIGMPPP